MQAMIAGNMVRLTQGDISTEFGIFIHQNVKDGETDMYALRKRLRPAEITPNDDDKVLAYLPPLPSPSLPRFYKNFMERSYLI